MRELDLAAIRARLAAEGGRTYWRSLDELADTPEFQDLLHREFPEQASEFADPAGRRQFLKLMGASLALAGVTGCTRQPAEKIVPYVRAPEEIVPGRPLFFATALPFAGSATPVLVESHMGRPTKIEPNPDHPSLKGGSDVFAQASILTLYDPDRARAIKNGDDIRPWGDLLQALQGAMNAQRPLKGAGLRILTETVTSPTLHEQITQVLTEFPEARWVQWEPVSRDPVREGARLAFGQDVEPQYAFDRAAVILSLDADFFMVGPGRLRWTRDFIDARRLEGGRTGMNRLYVAESTPTNTGIKADHRLALRASAIEGLARAIAARLGVAAAAAPTSVPGVPAGWIDAVVEDLQAHRGASIVVAGEGQPAAVHVLAHAINDALGNHGATITFTRCIEAQPSVQQADLQALAADLDAGRVDVLLLVGESNPAYSAPPDLRFSERMQKVPIRVQLSLFEDETARLCHWHVPMTHPLEAWSDARAFDGTVTICQPLIAPLFEGRSAHDLLVALSSRPDRGGHDVIREFWTRQWDGRAAGTFGPLTRADGTAHAGAEDFFRQALHDGYVPGSAFPPIPVSFRGEAVPAPSPAAAAGTEIVFRPSATVWDGRFANNGWLQELPDPVSKITWDNAVHVSPAMAERLGVRSGYQRATTAGMIGTEQATDVVELTLHGATVRMPVWILPGQPDDSVMVRIGYGRQRAGHVGDGVGVDVNALRPSAARWIASGAQIATTGDRWAIACTQHHFAIEGRNHLRAGTLADYTADPEFAHHLGHVPADDMTLWNNPWKYEGNAWGMSIDLNACVGCNACVVACQSENNIPVVGKEQVLRQREMHWIRIDRYYAGNVDDPDMYFQPMLCQHCENAPCEVVCPVAATVHSSEGLNDMVYNRCVGTRYCSNNCPYKVRRFNFLLYADWDTPTLKMARNPDVTVRSRGVMEKCTYCVQRINHARIDAKREDRPIRDGEIVTACEAACPARAIVFGNLNDPNAEITRQKKEPRTYGVLADLNTRPRTTYQAAVRNPNPKLAPAGTTDTTHH
jgi:molybdopterin-containing oxidoreductase family iron-sulfur binding subunit